VDWRRKGAITPVLDQGMRLGGGFTSCGSGWAFAATGAISAAYQIATGSLVLLSEQQFVDCAPGDCKGGSYESIRHAQSNALCTKQSYPYTGVDGDSCDADQCSVALPLGSVSDIGRLAFARYSDRLNMQMLMSKVSEKPVAIEVFVDSFFGSYGQGIFKGPCTGTPRKMINHAVLVIGYGVVEGQTYWLLKNSWGLTWGEVGYMRLSRGEGSSGFGLCNIYWSAYYAVINTGAATPALTPAPAPPQPPTSPPSITPSTAPTWPPSTTPSTARYHSVSCTNAVGYPFSCGAGSECCGNACAAPGSKCCRSANRPKSSWYPVSHATPCAF